MSSDPSVTIRLDEHQAFIDFLQTNYGKISIPQLVAKWNVFAELQGFKPTNRGVVHYWLDKGMIKASSTDPAQRFARMREKRVDYLRRGDLARAKAKEQREIRRAELLKLREEVLQSNPEAAVAVCTVCLVGFPKSSVFFDSTGMEGDYLILRRCKICQEEFSNDQAFRRRRHRTFEAQDAAREVTEEVRRRNDSEAEAEINEAKAERDRLIEAKPKTQLQNCVRCNEPWPLIPERYRMKQNPSGQVNISKVCNFCEREIKRQHDRLARDGKDAAVVLEQKKALLAAKRAEERRQEVEKIKKEAAKKKGPKRQCPDCQAKMPFTPDYWQFRSPVAESIKTGRLQVARCLFCQQEVVAEQKRKRKERTSKG